MRVLVTGHKGYLGNHIVDQLKANGHTLTGFDSDLFRGCNFPIDAAPRPESNVTSIQADIRDITRQSIAGHDAIIHLAGLSNDPLGDFDPQLTYEINHISALRIARIAKEAGVSRMILASSCSVYGANGQDLLTENAAFNPVTPYAISKLRMEEDIAKLADSSFSPVFLRSGTVYGTSPRLRFDLVVNNLVAWATATGNVLLKSDGSSWRPLIHIKDVARTFVAMLDAPRQAIHCQAFNVAVTNENYRVSEIAQRIEQVLQNCTVVTSKTACRDARNYRVSGDKLGALLGSGWNRFHLDDGITELENAFKATPVSPEEFEGPRYQRLGHLKSLIDDGVLNASLRFQSNADHSAHEAAT